MVSLMGLLPYFSLDNIAKKEEGDWKKWRQGGEGGGGKGGLNFFLSKNSIHFGARSLPTLDDDYKKELHHREAKQQAV